MTELHDDLDCETHMSDPNSHSSRTTPIETSAGADMANERRLRQFTGYETLGVLGVGGMGVVYQARQTALKRLVAIKTLRNYREATAHEIERFRFEAEIVAQFQHPNIVPLFHIGDEQGQPFLAFEFVDGGTLAKQINATPQPPREAAKLVETLARAVHAAHLRGVVHRDLTPNNVLLTANGIPKIADFGLARMQERSGISADNIAGTASYMAPEQAWGDVQGQSVGPLTDVYGLGAILYELLCGRPPFKASTSQKTLLMVYNDQPVNPQSIVPGVPRDLEAICLCCLRKDPIQRFTSAESLANDLRRFLQGEPITCRPIGKPERIWKWSKRNPMLFGLICSLAGMIAIGFIAITSEMLSARRAEAIERRRADELDAASFRDHFLMARIALEASDVDRAVKLLNECNPDRRSFEWGYLSKECQASCKTLPWTGREIAELEFCPTGQSFAVTSPVGAIRLIDVWNGAILHEFLGFNLRTSSPVFSPDGHQLALAGAIGPEHWILIWDVASGRELKKIGPLIGRCLAVRFLSNDGEICSLSFDENESAIHSTRPLAIEHWNQTSGNRIRYTKGPETDCFTTLSDVSAAFSWDGRLFAWSPKGKLPLAFKHQSKIYLCDTQSGLVLHTLTEPTGVEPVRFALSPDSQYLGSFGDEGNGTVWRVSDGSPLLKLQYKNSTYAIKALAFSKDCRTVAIGDAEMGITIRDPENGKGLQRFRGRQSQLNGLTFSPDGRFLVSSGASNPLVRWQTRYSKPQRLTIMKSVIGIQLNLDDVYYWSLAGELYQVNTIEESKPKFITDNCHCLAFSPDNSRFAIISNNGGLRIGVGTIESPTEEIRGLPPLTTNGNSLAFSRDGTSLACVSKDQSKIFLVDIPANKLRLEIPSQNGRIESLAFQIDGQRMAAGGEANTIFLWDTVSGKSAGQLATDFPIRQLAFRPSSNDLAAIGGDTNFVQFWNLQTREPRLRIENHRLQVHCIAFTPDGRRLITAGEDGRVKITDADSGQELLVLHEALHGVSRLAIRSDGRKLVAVELGLDGNNDFQCQIPIWYDD